MKRYADLTGNRKNQGIKSLWGNKWNETIRAGQITGTFADVINWGSEELNTFGVALKEDTEANKEWNQAVMDAKTSEDFFNLALQECSTEAERADLIMRTMAEQGLAEAGQAYRDVNADIIAANDSQNELDQAWGTLGETVAPIAEFFRGTLADALGAVNNVVQGGIEMVGDLGIIFSDLHDKINKWIESWDFSGVEAAIDRINSKAANTKWGDGTQLASAMAMASNMDAIPHAMGLNWVPYDGYLAELHQGEAVLTAQEADLWRALKEANRAQPAAVTAADIQSATSAMMGGFAAVSGGGGGADVVINLTTELDGEILSRKQLRYNAKASKLAGVSAIDGEVG